MTLDEFLSMPLVVPEGTVLPKEVRPVLDEVCERHNILPRHIFNRKRHRQVVEARADFIRTLHFKYRYLPDEVACVMEMDLTSVKHYLGMRTKAKVSYEDLRKLYR